MAQVLVRIIELLVDIGLGGATIAMFALAVIFIVSGLRSAGRHP